MPSNEPVLALHLRREDAYVAQCGLVAGARRPEVEPHHVAAFEDDVGVVPAVLERGVIHDVDLRVEIIFVVTDLRGGKRRPVGTRYQRHHRRTTSTSHPCAMSPETGTIWQTLDATCDSSAKRPRKILSSFTVPLNRCSPATLEVLLS